MSLIGLLMLTALAGSLAFSHSAASSTASAPALPTLHGRQAINYLAKAGLAASLRTAALTATGVPFSQQAKLEASDGQEFDHFGESVSISGDTAVIGAPFADINEVPVLPQSGVLPQGVIINQGAAYVFVRSGTVWTQQQKLTASDGAFNDGFGFSVAISGETIVVGALNQNGGQGAAYVFARSGGVWSEQQKLTPSFVTVEFFGSSVGISGETIVVGAPGNTGFLGAAYVFEREGTIWQERQQLFSGERREEEQDQFGIAVAISDDTIVVGALADRIGGPVGGNFEQGSAWVFRRSGAVWDEETMLLASDGAELDQFGSSVGIHNNTIIVGAHGPSGIQAAYVFTRSLALWSEQQKLTPSDEQAAGFGFSVGISGDTAVVGALQTNSNQGAAYVFERSGTTWNETQTLTADDGSPGDNLGRGVSIDLRSILIGAVGEVSSGNERGAAYVFVPACDLNTPPVINLIDPEIDPLIRQQGSPARNSILATYSDAETSADQLTVTVRSTSQGLLVTDVVNLAGVLNGILAANIAADCLAQTGPNTIEITVSDGCATVTAELIVTVTANTPPSLGTYPETSVLEGGSVTVTPSAPPADNGTINDLEVSFSPASFAGGFNLLSDSGQLTIIQAAPAGRYTVTLAATDNCGAISTTSFFLNVNRAPAIECPANIEVNNAPGQCAAPVQFAATATGFPEPIITCVPPSGIAFPVGVTTVICTASNGVGTDAQCSFTVAVNDTEPPTLLCPANLTINTPLNSCSAVAIFNPTAIDNCPGVSVVASPPSGTNFPVGTTTVEVRATDRAGNVSACQFTITVRDAQPPAITCPSDISIILPAGQNCLTVSYATPTATDNCTEASVVCSPPSGSCFPLGVTTVTCMARDASGNTGSCAFTVTAFDTCLQDDSNAARSLLINSQTGDYRFCCGEENFTGRGSLRRQGSVLTLTHNTSERRVQARIDASVNRATAVLQSTSGAFSCSITDRDTRNNACSCAERQASRRF